MYNLAGSLSPMALSLITVPVYLHLIGPSRYGALGLSWLLLGYFGVFDLGLSAATAQRIAARRDVSAKARAETFWTALFINLGFGTVGGLLLSVLSSYFFDNLFLIEDALRPELQLVAPWLGLAVPIATVSGVMSGSLLGREQFLALNIISASSSILLQMLPLIIAWKVGPNLGLLLSAVIVARVIPMGILFLWCHQNVAERHAPGFVATEASHLLKFGGWVTVTSLVGPLMVVCDRFVIGALLGAKAVTYYTVPFQMAERIAVIPSALLGALFPRLSVADPADEKRAGELATRVLAALLAPVFMGALLLIEPFMQFWLGREFSELSSPVARIILVSLWMNCLARIPYTRLQARGYPDLVAKTHLAELLPYAAFLYVGMRLLGLEGAAIVFGLRVLADLIILEFLAGNLVTTTKLLAIPTALLGIGFVAAGNLPPFCRSWFTAAALLSTAVAIWSWSVAPEHLREMIRRAVRWWSAAPPRLGNFRST
jgi:O-antigen/teichoic acid export membrane protein